MARAPRRRHKVETTCRTARRHGTPCRSSRPRRHNAFAAAGRVRSGSRSPAGTRRKSPVFAGARRSRLRPCVRGTRRHMILPLAVIVPLSIGSGEYGVPLNTTRPRLPAAACRSPYEAFLHHHSERVGLSRPPIGPRVGQSPRNACDLIAARAAKALDLRPDINGLRALAVLGVVHLPRRSGSGFRRLRRRRTSSLSSPAFSFREIVLAQCAAGRFSLAMFCARRAKRILPRPARDAEFRLDDQVVHDFADPIARDWRRSAQQFVLTIKFWLMRLAGVGGSLGVSTTVKPLLHLWSLSIEEQFYLVWSVLLLGCSSSTAARPRRHSLPVRRLVRVQRVLTPIDPIAAFYLPWTRGWELALGALHRLSGGVLARGPALSVAAHRQHRRSSRNRADARRLLVPERAQSFPGGSRRSRHLAPRWSSPVPIRFRARLHSATAWPVSLARSRIRSICGTGRSSPSPASGRASSRRRRFCSP